MKKPVGPADFGLLVFRLFVGLSMAIAHGMHKMPPGEQFIGGVAALGFPMPMVFAWAAALSEMAGGFLIALGYFVRPASLFLGFTMAVAAFGQHAQDEYKVKELALFYLFSCILLALQGAGKYSLDRILRKK